MKEQAFLSRKSPDRSIPLTRCLLNRMKWHAHAHPGRIHRIPASANHDAEDIRQDRRRIERELDTWIKVDGPWNRW